MVNYVDLWRWQSDFVRTASLRGDTQRLNLVSLQDRMWELKEKDPTRALAVCEQGIALAQQLNEPCWELYHAYWASEMLIYYIGDIEAGVALAVKNVVKASKEPHIQCPARSRVMITLISVYAMRDPVGYASEIHEMVGHIEAGIPMDLDTHQRLQYYRALMEVEFDRYDEAFMELMRYMDMCPFSAFRQQSGYGLLIDIELQRHNDHDALMYASLLEESARRADFDSAVAMGLLWQAAIGRKLNPSDDNTAALLRRGQAMLGTLPVKRGASYFTTLSGYYEAGNELDDALRIRDEQVTYFAEHKLPASECEAHLQRCRILRKLNRLTDVDLATARACADKLLKPERYLSELQRVQAGEQVRGVFHVSRD